MRSFKAAFALSFATIGFAAADEKCKYALEILQLQDASQTLSDDIDSLKSVTNDLFNQLNEEYPGVRYGLATFTDKPIPIRGYGNYGGWGNVGFLSDYCYNKDMDFATTSDELNAALNKVMFAAGNDNAETMLEAMIYASQDKTLSWTQGQYSPDGRPIVRFSVMITDGAPHKEGEAQTPIDQWNMPRSYPNGIEGNSTGGYGAMDLDGYYDESIGGWPLDYFIPRDYYTGYEYFQDWVKFSNLLKKVDFEQPLTEQETTDIKALNEFFGPSTMPTVTSPHPGVWDPTDCQSVEYPTPVTTANQLVEANIFPIVLVADPGLYLDQYWFGECPQYSLPTQSQDCLVYMWQNIMTEMGITGAVAKLGASSTDIVEVMLNQIRSIVGEVCVTTTSTTTPATVPTVAPTEPTVAPTEPTVAPTEPTVAPTEPTVAPTVPTTAPTAAPTATTNGGDATTNGGDATTKGGDATTKGGDATTNGGDATTKGGDATTANGDATTNGGDATTKSGDATTKAGDATTASVSTTSMRGGNGSTTTTTTTTPVVVPVAPASGGTNTAVVAAAGAGAAAAAAAAAAFAYTKFGAGFMGGKTPAGLEAVQQVDIPESPLEREAMEEVTMDMFQ